MSHTDNDPRDLPPDLVPGVVKAGAVAAIVGGAIWVLKGGLVLVAERESLAGVDLGLLFVVIQGLFAVAVIGVEELLGERGGRKAEVGLWFAYAAVFLSLVNLAIWVVRGPAAVPGVTTFFASIGWIIGAVLVGIPAMRHVLLGRPWNAVPLAIGIAAPVALVVFGWIADLAGERRILELPVVLLGALWAAYGVELWWAGWRARWAKGSVREGVSR